MRRPWSARRGLELALLVLVSALAAIGVNAALEGAADLPPPAEAPAAVSPPTEPLDAWTPIVARDVFNSGASAPAAAAARLRLVGVGFQGGEARAAIEDLASHHQELVRTGDTVGDARVGTIAWDHVVLATPHGETTLELAPRRSDESPADADAAPAAAPRAPAGATVRQIAANAFVVDRRELEGVEGMSGLMTQLRAVAEVEDGHPAGFRLFQITDGSLFRRLGLENGDVVQRVNGQAVADPATLLGFIQRLRTEPRVALDIRRGGERRTLVYDLR
jgi:general secretion pathway protein C